MAVSTYNINSRISHVTAAEIDANNARLRPRDTNAADAAHGMNGVEDVSPFTNTAASARTNSRMTLP